MPGTRETEGESAARQFTSPSPGEQCIVLMRVLVSPLVFPTKYVARWVNVRLVSCGDAWLRDVVLEGQAAVVITHWDDEVPWVDEEVGRFRIWEGGGVVG